MPTAEPARWLHARTPAAIGLFVAALLAAGPAQAADIVPGRVVVRFATRSSAPARVAVARSSGVRGSTIAARQPGVTRVLHLEPGTSVAAAARRLRRDPSVLWAVPDYRAHAAGFIPNDPGRGTAPGGWQAIQWNLAGPFGVDAPQAWSNLAAVGAYGGHGVTVAVLDTGVAYENRGRYQRSPDFGARQFARGRDFVDGGRHPDDHNGHGTHVAGTIAEATNNGIGLVGLAYGAKILPVRVLDTQGEGAASVIAKGVRFAISRHVQVINLSLEFGTDVTAADIPQLLSALRLARRHGVLVVAAAGNEGTATIAYPARARTVVSVGATTEHGCLASFSNDGPRLTIVAPGGGADAPLPGDPHCRPEGPPGRDVFQVTFSGPSPRRFGIPPGYEGTSMAAPHVSATAALVIASGVIGPHPTPDAIVARLRATSRPLGVPSDTARYGGGLLNAATATTPGPPQRPPA